MAGRHRRVALFFLASWLVALCAAAQAAPRLADGVFELATTRAADGGLVLAWTIAPGDYLYHDSIVVTTEAGDVLPARIGKGEDKDDPNFGAVEIHRGRVEATIAARDVPASGRLRVAYQGCADQGLCLPPVHKSLDLATLAIADAAAAPPTGNAPDRLRSILSGDMAAALVSFLGFGLMLSLTPCVFPMIPIVSGMIAGANEERSVARGLKLSSAYVLAMAAAYAAIGLVAAWTGRNLQLILEAPAAVAAMSLVFVGLAASMFGLFELQIPGVWTQRIAGATAGRSDSLAGAALLGFGSALIVGPCVTPPLAAALLYVAQSGDVARGAAALFALGLGMGFPLIAFGALGSKSLPKSGPWLIVIKQAFGFVFLALAIAMLGRILSANLISAAWAGLALGAAVWLALFDRARAGRVRQCFSHLSASNRNGRMKAAAGLAGLAIVAAAGAVFIGRTSLEASPEEGTVGRFVRTVSTPAGFDAALGAARLKGKPILIDFTATWCASCRAIDAVVLADPQIRARLETVSIIRADISAYSADERGLMERFGVVGPPTLLFIDPQSGREIADGRRVGEVTASEFARFLDRAGA